MQRKRISPWAAVGRTTSWDWIRASSSSTVLGELPRPARCCHISRLFHSTKARKQTRMWASTRSARWCQIGRIELIFLDAEGRFGLGKLDIGLPELFIAPVGDIRAQ